MVGLLFHMIPTVSSNVKPIDEFYGLIEDAFLLRVFTYLSYPNLT